MASKTANYNLDMPAYNEIADIDVINGNMDKIDVQMKKNADSAQQSKDIVSDEYSATNTYAVGDYCIHENILYKCKTAITTGEAFDSNKWIQTTCGTEFGELNSNLDALEFGEVAGGKNYWSFGNITVQSSGYVWQNKPLNLPIGTYTFSAYSDMLYNLILYDANGNTLTSIANSEINKMYSNTFTIHSDVAHSTLYAYEGTIEDIQIEEGTVRTDYESFIPSVKMLAEEVNQQKNDLSNFTSGLYIDGDTDWNTIKTSGMYYYNGWSGSGGSNKPTETKSTGMVFVLNSGIKLLQFVVLESGNSYFRSGTVDELGNWTTIS